MLLCLIYALCNYLPAFLRKCVRNLSCVRKVIDIFRFQKYKSALCRLIRVKKLIERNRMQHIFCDYVRGNITVRQCSRNFSSCILHIFREYNVRSVDLQIQMASTISYLSLPYIIFTFCKHRSNPKVFHWRQEPCFHLRSTYDGRVN
jgi:hypothetical protein